MKILYIFFVSLLVMVSAVRADHDHEKMLSDYLGSKQPATTQMGQQTSTTRAQPSAVSGPARIYEVGF